MAQTQEGEVVTRNLFGTSKVTGALQNRTTTKSVEYGVLKRSIQRFPYFGASQVVSIARPDQTAEETSTL